MNPQEASLTLNLLPKLGPITCHRLVATLGSPQAVLNATTAELRQVKGIGPELAQQIHQWEKHVNPTRELRELEERGLDFIHSDDPRFPVNLQNIHDPPLGLYVWGELQERDQYAIAVVGSRQCTRYGIQSARKLSYQLARAGVTILSGLARGIDTAAHEGAIAAEGRTIAVIGSGLAQVYPPENLPLAQRIADGNGAVISEFPLHWGPNKTTFPMRNRIVSGWSRGVLVAEARERSGALITANLAADQGRSIYAIPGPIDKESSAGCNQLIKDGAQLVTDANDILEGFHEFQFAESTATSESAPKRTQSGPRPDLDHNEKALLDAMGDEEVSCDELVERTHLPAFQVTTALMQLELKRQVQALPGSRYIRCR